MHSCLLDEKKMVLKEVEVCHLLIESYPIFFPIIFIQRDIPPGKNISIKILTIAKPIPQKMIIVINCLFIMIYINTYYEEVYHYFLFNNAKYEFCRNFR